MNAFKAGAIGALTTSVLHAARSALLKTPWLTEPIATTRTRSKLVDDDTHEKATNRQYAKFCGLIALICSVPAGIAYGGWGVTIALAIALMMLFAFIHNMATSRYAEFMETVAPEDQRFMLTRALKAYAFAQRAVRVLPEVALPPNFETDGVFQALATPWGVPKIVFTVYGKRQNSTLRDERLVVVDLPTAWIDDEVLSDEAVQQCAKAATAATEQAIAAMKPGLMVVC
jgi:hypothetical protein